MFELAEWVMQQRARRAVERAAVRAALVRLLLRWSEIRRGIARGEIDPAPHMAGLERWPWLLPLYSSAQRIAGCPSYSCWFCWNDGGQVRAAVSALVFSQRYVCAACLAQHEMQMRADRPCLLTS